MRKQKDVYLPFLVVLCICVSQLSIAESISSTPDPVTMAHLFASEGFGFKYIDSEIENYETFIKNHGKPSTINRTQIINRHDGYEDEQVVLEYEQYSVHYYSWGMHPSGVFPHSMLSSIRSKNGVDYLFGIKHGTSIAELEAIFGITVSDNVSCMMQSNNSHWVTFYFENNVIKNITWDYSLE